MSMTVSCKDCRGRDACTMEVCLFPENESYITEQKPVRDKETKRRKELKQQLDSHRGSK